MKQVIQNYKTGELGLAEVPRPAIKAGGVLVRNVNSLVSVGTEKLMIDLAKKSLLGKALARPDLVKQVINKIKTEGLMEARRQAMGRLDSPVPLGYSCAGEVIEVGAGVDQFAVGDRLACSGYGFASHAEVVLVPQNLCAKIPEGVDYESAAFCTLGAIALHGVRSAQLTLGENVVVIGLGLLGQIACQIVKASGCTVFGVDVDREKVSLAIELGADQGAVSEEEDVEQRVRSSSGGYGADAVLVFASTSSSQPVELAAEISRDRGRVVIPGMVKLDLPRKIFYEKELTLVVPRSSGPGTYDPIYETKGIDYPLSYVRWTQRRNIEEFLDLVASGKVELGRIITHRFKTEDAEKAYQLIMEGKEKYIGVLLCYEVDSKALVRKVWLKREEAKRRTAKGQIGVGLIGAGLFASTTMLPTIKQLPFVRLRGVATATGVTGQHVGDKFGFEYCTSDYHDLLNDEAIDCVMIATRHNLHAKLAVDALTRGKDVFVEKPLALSVPELKQVMEAWKESKRRLMVGFNRRFAPSTVKAKQWLGKGSEPIIINCRVNAGFIPKDSWVQDPEEGGGRIIGEACHFVDLIQYLSDAMPTKVYTQAISGEMGIYSSQDNVIISIGLEDGSVASITYVASGDKAYPKEKVEIFGNGSVCIIDNFKSVTFVKGGRTRKFKKSNVDRGYQAEFSALFTALRDGKPIPVDFTEYVFTTLATFCAVESIEKGHPIDLDPGILGIEA